MEAAARLRKAFGDERALGPARRKVADDWAAARQEWAVFGVPTLHIRAQEPVYMRLERAPEPGPEAWICAACWSCAPLPPTSSN